MYIIKDQYQMPREDAVFVAKKYLKESVYRSAFLEGIAVTFPQTEEILDGAIVNNVSTKDISKVFGLRDGWKYILDHLDVQIDLEFLENLHELVAKEDVPWDKLGVLRTQNVRISGTNYLPEIPNAEKVHQDLSYLQENPNETDRAITIMLYLMRAQLFLDGNKRIATLAGNQILIRTGRGIFSLPPEYKEEFTEKLVRFYESGDMDEVKELIAKNCLTGMR